MRLERLAQLLLYTSLIYILPSVADAQPQKIVSYYPAWSIGSPLDVQGERMTHLIYAFLHVSDEGVCELLPDVEESAQSALNDFKKLKSKFPNLKTMFAIGGADNSDMISGAVKNAAGRKKLVRSCLRFFKDYDFDGVDVDWEYPTAKEKNTLVALLKEFRAQLPQGALLSAAVTADNSIDDLNVSAMADVLDWFGVMAYDRCDQSAKVTCHHAQFTPSDSSTLGGQQAVEKYLNAGANPHQIILGIPFYGYKWNVSRLDSQDHNGIGQKISLTGKKKTGVELSFRQIKENYLNQQEYHYAFDADAQEPVIFNDDTGEVISFEDPRSIAFKRQEAIKLDLGGLMVWDIVSDDEQHTLLNALTGESLSRVR